MLKREAEKFQPQVAQLPHPRVAVLIGGSNAVYHLTPREMEILAAQLKALADGGASLMITPSRRTGEENMALLQETLRDTSAYIWDGQGANPYYGMLGLADALLSPATASIWCPRLAQPASRSGDQSPRGIRQIPSHSIRRCAMTA